MSDYQDKLIKHLHDAGITDDQLSDLAQTNAALQAPDQTDDMSVGPLTISHDNDTVKNGDMTVGPLTVSHPQGVTPQDPGPAPQGVTPMPPPQAYKGTSKLVELGGGRMGVADDDGQVSYLHGQDVPSPNPMATTVSEDTYGDRLAKAIQAQRFANAERPDAGLRAATPRSPYDAAGNPWETNKAHTILGFADDADPYNPPRPNPDAIKPAPAVTKAQDAVKQKYLQLFAQFPANGTPSQQAVNRAMAAEYQRELAAAQAKDAAAPAPPSEHDAENAKRIQEGKLTIEEEARKKELERIKSVLSGKKPAHVSANFAIPADDADYTDRVAHAILAAGIPQDSAGPVTDGSVMEVGKPENIQHPSDVGPVQIDHVPDQFADQAALGQGAGVRQGATDTDPRRQAAIVPRVISNAEDLALHPQNVPGVAGQAARQFASGTARTAEGAKNLAMHPETIPAAVERTNQQFIDAGKGVARAVGAIAPYSAAGMAGKAIGDDQSAAAPQAPASSIDDNGLITSRHAGPQQGMGVPGPVHVPAQELPIVSPERQQGLALSGYRAVHGDQDAGNAKADQETAKGNALDTVQQGIESMVKSEQQQELARQNILTNFNSRLQKQATDIATEKVDPKRLWNNMGAGEKAFKVLALMLGGAAAAINGGPNLAQQELDKQVDADIEAQKANIANKKTGLDSAHNQLAEYRLMFGDQRAAEAAMRADRYNQFKAYTDSVIAKTNDPIERARATAESARLQFEIQKSLAAANHYIPEHWQQPGMSTVDNDQYVPEAHGVVFGHGDAAEKLKQVLRASANIRSLLAEASGIRAVNGQYSIDQRAKLQAIQQELIPQQQQFNELTRLNDNEIHMNQGMAGSLSQAVLGGRADAVIGQYLNHINQQTKRHMDAAGVVPAERFVDGSGQVRTVITAPRGQRLPDPQESTYSNPSGTGFTPSQ